MRARSILVLGVCVAVAATGFMSVGSDAGPKGKKSVIEERGLIGPDVVAFTIGGQNSEDIDYAGSSGGIGGYAIATQSCNVGDETLNWYGGTNNTPLISQNAFRLKNGRFEQIGVGWLKHSFCALSEPGCGNCQATDCNTLGIGCADTYWAGLNLNGEGPRSDVNAYLGSYDVPFSINSTGPSSIRANLQILNSDVDPSQNSGARFFIEAQYIATDDATAGNANNNASYREVMFTSISNVDVLDNNGAAETHAGDPAIQAWADIDPEVELTVIDTPNDGRVFVAVKVSENADGTYHYEYAIQNLNCHRSVGRVSIPMGDASISNIGFHDVFYHSGEIYDGTDWSVSDDNGILEWATESYEQNENANAIRWGTLYNYRFDSNAAPEPGNIELGFFRPAAGNPSSFAAGTMVPAGAVIDPCELPLTGCPSDVDGDYVVAVGDVLAIIGSYGDCGDGTYRPDGDVDGDCCVTVSDILAVIGDWGQDCTPEGACCLPEGGCAVISESHCAQEGGTYAGDNSTCGSVNCPEPGACCFADGTCVEVLPDNCQSLGGDYQGAGSDCGATSCPVAGAGDECTSPLIANIGENSFETYTATPSGNEPDDSQCSGTYLDWDGSADIWFLWVADGSGNAYFSTCDGGSYDTSMVLYEGSCDNQVACNGDADGEDGCQAYYSALDYNVEAGETYYIRIGGWLGETGEGTLTIK